MPDVNFSEKLSELYMKIVYNPKDQGHFAKK